MFRLFRAGTCTSVSKNIRAQHLDVTSTKNTERVQRTSQRTLEISRSTKTSFTAWFLKSFRNLKPKLKKQCDTLRMKGFVSTLLILFTFFSDNYNFMAIWVIWSILATKSGSDHLVFNLNFKRFLLNGNHQVLPFSPSTPTLYIILTIVSSITQALSTKPSH